MFFCNKKAFSSITVEKLLCSSEYYENENLWLFCGKIYISNTADFYGEVVDLYHDLKIVGYLDRWKTLELVSYKIDTLYLELYWVLLCKLYTRFLSWLNFKSWIVTTTYLYFQIVLSYPRLLSNKSFLFQTYSRYFHWYS